MNEIDAGIDHAAPVWAVFGDLMSGLLGAFVLILVGVLGVQLELVSSLEAEIHKRQQEEQRRQALEKALAGPLASLQALLEERQALYANADYTVDTSKRSPLQVTEEILHFLRREGAVHA